MSIADFKRFFDVPCAVEDAIDFYAVVAFAFLPCSMSSAKSLKKHGDFGDVPVLAIITLIACAPCFALEVSRDADAPGRPQAEIEIFHNVNIMMWVALGVRFEIPLSLVFV